MPGTREGGINASKTNKERYDARYAEYGGYYGYIGSLGGSKSTGGGFSRDHVGKDGLTGPERARIAGAKGGAVARDAMSVLKRAVEKARAKGLSDTDIYREFLASGKTERAKLFVKHYMQKQR